MTQTLTRVYEDYPTAERTVRDLKVAGLGDSDIGIVASNADGWHKPGSNNVDPKHDKDRDGNDDRSEGALTGGIGAAVGGAAGLAAGLGRARRFWSAATRNQKILVIAGGIVLVLLLLKACS